MKTLSFASTGSSGVVGHQSRSPQSLHSIAEAVTALEVSTSRTGLAVVAECSHFPLKCENTRLHARAVDLRSIPLPTLVRSRECFAAMIRSNGLMMERVACEMMMTSHLMHLLEEVARSCAPVAVSRYL